MKTPANQFLSNQLTKYKLTNINKRITLRNSSISDGTF